MQVQSYYQGRRAAGHGWLWLAGLLLLPPAALAADRPVLTLNDTNDPPYTTPEQNGFLDIIAAEAFRRVGVDLKLVKLPPERGLISANAGVEDGDLTRIAGLEKLYPNLIRVPEKLVDWEFMAFSRNAAIPASWPVLRQHSIGHIKGWKIYEQQLVSAEHVTTVTDADQLFRMLDLGRIEVALYERSIGNALVQRQQLQGIRLLTPVLATREMFIYLNRRHAQLVPGLVGALRDMKRDGFYSRVYHEKLKPYREGPAP